MYSRRGSSTALIMLAAAAILHLKLGSAPCGSSFTRLAGSSGLAPSRGWSLDIRLKHLHRNSFFRKSSGGAELTANRKQRPLLYNKDEVDLDRRADTPMGFGKHKFMTYGEMVRDEPHYCAAVSELQDLRDEQVDVHDFQDYLEAIDFEEPLSFPPTSPFKHAGKTFKEVMETEPLYCSWVLNSDTPGFITRFRNFLKDEGFEPADLEAIVPSGRHKGKPFSEVLRDDPEYCTRLKSVEEDINGMLGGFQKYLQEQDFEDVLTCGKHAGKPFEEVMTVDPTYCAWAMRTSSPLMLGFKNFLASKGFTHHPHDTIKVGKYKGMTFEEVMTEDPSYCVWVMRSSTEGLMNSSSISRFHKFLESKEFSWKDMITQGKYKGKTFEEVMREQPSYCGWVMRLSVQEGSNMCRLKKFLESRGFSASPSQDILEIGKHEGKTYEEVMTEDPSYCAWVMRQSTETLVTNSSVVLRFKQFLESKGFLPTRSQDVLPIGKHKGKTYEEIVTQDPIYASWVMDLRPEGNISSSLLRFREFLQDSKFQGRSENTMTFGKYEGKTFESILREDPAHCAFVMRLIAEEGTNSSVMVRFKKFLEKQGFSRPPAEEVLAVGKYKGKTFEKVMTEHPTYASWVMGLRTERMSSGLLRFKEFLQEKEFSSMDIVVVGKHRGRPFKDVMAEDPSYCEWVKGLSIEGTAPTAMLRFKKFLDDKGFQSPSSMKDMKSRATAELQQKSNTAPVREQDVVKEGPSYARV